MAKSRKRSPRTSRKRSPLRINRKSIKKSPIRTTRKRSSRRKKIKGGKPVLFHGMSVDDASEQIYDIINEMIYTCNSDILKIVNPIPHLTVEELINISHNYTQNKIKFDFIKSYINAHPSLQDGITTMQIFEVSGRLKTIRDYLNNRA